MRQLVYLLAFLCLVGCQMKKPYERQDHVVFGPDSQLKGVDFKPTEEQIDKAEIRFLNFLLDKTEIGQTIYITNLGEKVHRQPLQNQLQYYKRRYSGLTTPNREKIIKIEFVFVRCGGNKEWKQINYTTEQMRGCWWSVQYNIDRDEITNLD